MSVITFMADSLEKKFKLQIQKDELSYFDKFSDLNAEIDVKFLTKVIWLATSQPFSNSECLFHYFYLWRWIKNIHLTLFKILICLNVMNIFVTFKTSVNICSWMSLLMAEDLFWQDSV